MVMKMDEIKVGDLIRYWGICEGENIEKVFFVTEIEYDDFYNDTCIKAIDSDMTAEVEIQDIYLYANENYNDLNIERLN